MNQSVALVLLLALAWSSQDLVAQEMMPPDFDAPAEVGTQSSTEPGRAARASGEVAASEGNLAAASTAFEGVDDAGTPVRRASAPAPIATRAPAARKAEAPSAAAHEPIRPSYRWQSLVPGAIK